MKNHAKVLENWFVTARPAQDDALAQIDEARARGLVTREEYLALLDAWPDPDQLF